MKIEVTTEDIAKGVREDCHGCPIALACKRLGVRDVAVEREAVVYRNYEGEWDEASMPEVGEAFIEAFDAGRDVEPFSFELDISAVEPK